MRQEPDNYEPIHWRNREGEPLRLVALIVILACLFMTGCTAPLISSDIRINDSLNNNEIPLIK